MSESEEDSKCYAAAGQLFGKLRDSLKFGDLVMFASPWLRFGEPRSMCYQWTFHAKGRKYCIEHSVLFIELAYTMSIESLAEHVSKRWTEHFKYQTEP